MKLLKLADLNPHFCEYRLRNHHVAPYHTLANPTPLVPPEPSAVPT